MRLYNRRFLARVVSSAGRASALQAEGRRFDPVITHHSSRKRDKQQPMQSLHCLPGAVVQLVRIPACHAGGRGFESRPLRHFLIEAPYVKSGTLMSRSDARLEHALRSLISLDPSNKTQKNN